MKWLLRPWHRRDSTAPDQLATQSVPVSKVLTDIMLFSSDPMLVWALSSDVKTSQLKSKTQDASLPFFLDLAMRDFALADARLQTRDKATMLDYNMPCSNQASMAKHHAQPPTSCSSKRKQQADPSPSPQGDEPAVAPVLSEAEALLAFALVDSKSL